MTLLDATVIAVVAALAGWITAAIALVRSARHAEKHRDAVERRYALLETIPDGLYILDRAERFTLVNEQAERLLHEAAGSLVGRGIVDVLGPLACDLVPEIRLARRDGTTIERTIGFRATDTTIEVRITPSARETLVSLRDISARTRADVRLRESESRFRLVMGQLPALLWTVDRQRIVTSATGAGTALVETRDATLVGKPFAALFRESEASAALGRALAGLPVQFESMHCDRRLRHDVEALRDESGALIGAIGVALDVTDMRNTQRVLADIARRDALTGLANRLGLEEQLDAAIAAAARSGTSFAVHFLDLDRFKAINDTLGHRTGDALLCAVAERLTAALGQDDALARHGGDEFVIIQRGIHDHHDVRAFAARIQRRLADAVLVDERELFLGASIGAALYPEHGATHERLLDCADLAMYRAKTAERGSFALYDPELHAATLRRRDLEADLRSALANDEFTIVYQPIVDATHRIVACEALLRWRHGTTEIAPSAYIAIAEELGVIVEITQHVLEVACAFAAGVRRIRPDFRLNVNISGRDLYDAALPAHVAAIVRRTGLPADALELEVNESVLLDERSGAALARLRALGVRVAIDDFRLASDLVSAMRRVAVTALKIDAEVVANAATDDVDRAMCMASVALARSLRLRLVAEGIETEAQMHFVLGLGVDEVQGHLTGKPVPPDQFLTLLDKIVPLDRASRRA